MTSFTFVNRKNHNLHYMSPLKVKDMHLKWLVRKGYISDFNRLLDYFEFCAGLPRSPKSNSLEEKLLRHVYYQSKWYFLCEYVQSIEYIHQYFGCFRKELSISRLESWEMFLWNGNYSIQGAEIVLAPSLLHSNILLEGAPILIPHPVEILKIVIFWKI